MARRYRQRQMNPLVVDVRSTLGGAVRTSSNRGTTARIDVRGPTELIDEETGEEIHIGAEQCWRVQLGRVDFNPATIADPSFAGAGGADPILARVQWGVDGVPHEAYVDWPIAGGSFVVSADVVEVEAIVPEAFTGPDPVALDFEVLLHALPFGADYKFLPYTLNVGPGITLPAGTLRLQYLAAPPVVTQTVDVAIAAGTYTAFALAATVSAALGAFAVPVVNFVFDNVSRRGQFGFISSITPAYGGGSTRQIRGVAHDAAAVALWQALGYSASVGFNAFVDIIPDDASPVFSEPTSSNGGAFDDMVTFPAGSYTLTALAALINAQLATNPYASWDFYFDWVGTTITSNLTSSGGGVWCVADQPPFSGNWTTEFGYLAFVPPGTAGILDQPENTTLTSNQVNFTIIDVTWGETAQAWMTLGATIVPDSGAAHQLPTRTIRVTTEINAGAGDSGAIAVPAYARSFRWHQSTNTTAGGEAAPISFVGTQTPTAITDTVVWTTPVTNTGALNESTSGESSWPTDDGITLPPTVRYLWVVNNTPLGPGAGDITVILEFVLDLV